MLKPWNGLRCCPLIAPSASRRDLSVRSAIWAMTSGSEYACDAGIGGPLPNRDVVQQPPDDRIARLIRGLGIVVEHDPMPQHRPRHGPDVLDAHAGAPGEGRARLRRDDQRLPRARPGAPRDPFGHVLGALLLAPSRRPD